MCHCRYLGPRSDRVCVYCTYGTVHSISIVSYSTHITHITYITQKYYLPIQQSIRQASLGGSRQSCYKSLGNCGISWSLLHWPSSSTWCGQQSSYYLSEWNQIRVFHSFPALRARNQTIAILSAHSDLRMDILSSDIITLLLEKCWLAPHTNEREVSALCREAISSRDTIRCLIEQNLSIFHKMLVINDESIAFLCCRSLHLLSILIYHMSSSLTGYEVTHIINSYYHSFRYRSWSNSVFSSDRLLEACPSKGCLCPWITHHHSYCCSITPSLLLVSTHSGNQKI